jgi:putative ABC transport system permease protein
MKGKRFLIIFLLLFAQLSAAACHILAGTNQPAGSASETLVSMELSLPSGAYSQAEQRLSFVQEMIKRIESLPEVQSVAAASTLPDSLEKKSTPVFVEGDPAAKLSLNYRAITSDYFDVTRLPLLAGRRFIEKDGPNQPGVVMLSASAARSLFPDSDPIGKRISFSQPQEGGIWLTIIGIAADVADKAATARAELYTSYYQNPTDTFGLIVRARSKSPTLVATVKRAIQAMDAQVTISRGQSN